MSATLEQRFWEKVQKTGEEECWVWSGTMRGNGYGAIRKDGRMKSAHRVSWRLAGNDIPEGMCILHKCDNPACVNPGHLFIGSHRQNMRDRRLKNRHARGERGGNSKLTKQNVLTIKRLRLICGISNKEIAQIYKIHPSTVSRIVRGERWSHVE